MQFPKMDGYIVSNFPYYNLSWAVEPDYLGSNPISVCFKLVVSVIHCCVTTIPPNTTA